VNLLPDESARILAHGVDSLVITADVLWKDLATFKVLEELKQSAISKDEDVPGKANLGGGDVFLFLLRPFGAGGYAWLLNSRDITFKIGNWKEPISRPSVIAEIRSEALWAQGVGVMVSQVVRIIKAWGGEVQSVRVSRVDVCVDVLMREDDWTLGLLDQFVTRANDLHPYLRRKVLTGIQVGKGAILARLYDKPIEIRDRSGKIWMYDIWGIESVPDGHRIIRVEFQLRRELLKSLRIDSVDDLLQLLPMIWAYCTQNWLKVQTGTGDHHTQRHTVAWWRVVQEGVDGALDCNPSVRRIANVAEINRTLAMIRSYIISYTAVMMSGRYVPKDQTITYRDAIQTVKQHLVSQGFTDEEFTERVKAKQAKNDRIRE